MLKKIIVMLIATSIALSLCACGNSYVFIYSKQRHA